MSKYIDLSNEIIKLYNLDNNPGQVKLPTESQLMQQYKVSRQTVRNALSVLSEQGLIASRQGSGYYTTGLSTMHDRNEVHILLPSINDYIYPDIWYSIKQTLLSEGFKANVFVTYDSIKREREILLSLLDNKPRLIIAEGCKSALPNPNVDLYQKLEEGGTFFIFLHNIYPNIKQAICIKDDNYYGGYLLGEYLLSKGHKMVAGIFQADSLQGLERYHGFICCMRDHGIIPSEEQICWFRSKDVKRLRLEQKADFLLPFLKQTKTSCTAILCYNDELAYWIKRTLLSLGMEIPKDKSLVSFDNSYLCTRGELSLTSIAHIGQEIPTTAALSAIQKLKGLPVSSLEIPWKIYERNSVNTL